ncbi:hypothetical protein [Hymenobacter ruber]
MPIKPILSASAGGKSSAYQLQANGRAKRAVKQVSVADTRVRAAARVLTDALALASKATAAVEAVNKAYGTSYPTTSKYVEAVAGGGVTQALAKAGEIAPTAEYPPVIGSFEDSKDGAALPGLAVLGEYEAPADVKTEKPAKAKARKEEAPADTVPA